MLSFIYLNRRVSVDSLKVVLSWADFMYLFIVLT